MGTYLMLERTSGTSQGLSTYQDSGLLLKPKNGGTAWALWCPVYLDHLDNAHRTSRAVPGNVQGSVWSWGLNQGQPHASYVP